MVPRFTNKVAQVIAKNKMEEVAVSFTNLTQEVTVMDEHSPSIEVIIKGQEVSRSIVDGVSGVNVINKLICDRLNIKVGNLSILAKNARYNQSPTIGLNSIVRCHHWWSHIPNFSHCF